MVISSIVILPHTLAILSTLPIIHAISACYGEEIELRQNHSISSCIVLLPEQWLLFKVRVIVWIVRPIVGDCGLYE